MVKTHKGDKTVQIGVPFVHRSYNSAPQCSQHSQSAHNALHSNHTDHKLVTVYSRSATARGTTGVMDRVGLNKNYSAVWCTGKEPTCASLHQSGVIMSAMAFYFTGVSFVSSNVCSGIKETSKLRITGHCEGNSPVTSEFPAQRASNEESVSIWWRHHGKGSYVMVSVHS